MPIHTALGPIEPHELGSTSMHEHILSDLALWCKPRTEEPPAGVPMGPGLRSYLAWNALALPENLILDDIDVAVEELTTVAEAGGSAVVELTLEGMGARVAELPEISRRSGVHVIIGAGFYVEETHPERLKRLSVDELTEELLDQLRNGREGVLPAILGEIGTSWPITEAEWRMVRAAGRAGAETGTAVYMHQSFRGPGGIDVLQALLDEGMPAERVIIGHLDEYFDKGYHRDIAQSGAILGYDTFGTDFYYGSTALRCPTDAERLDMVEWLAGEGFGEQLIIAADVWSQGNLRRNGGNGYDHLFRRIGPAITRIAGDDGALINTIMVENPRRLLNRP